MNWLASKHLCFCLAQISVYCHLSNLKHELWPKHMPGSLDFLTKQNKVSNANNLKRATAE